METLVIKIDNKINAAKIKEAVKQFKGVKEVSEKLNLSDIDKLENTSILKAVKAGRKTPKVDESEILKALK
jgi:hypothetical protein